MFDYLARMTVLVYPWSLAVAGAAAVLSAARGEWDWAPVVIACAGLGSLQFAMARWWLRTSEDNAVRDWMRDNPDHDASR